MITGALASSYYGEPRTTADIDFVLRIQQKEISRLLISMTKSGLEANRTKVTLALKAGYRILTFRDKKSSNTIDIILSRGKLSRRPGSILGLPTHYQAPEELILAKLRMMKATMNPERSMKDKQDIRAILNFTKVNLDAVKRKAKRETTIGMLMTILP